MQNLGIDEIEINAGFCPNIHRDVPLNQIAHFESYSGCARLLFLQSTVYSSGSFTLQ